MSLYDDVEDVPGTNQSEEPQPSIVKVHFKPASPEKPAIDLRFLQSQLKAKKAQLQNAPTTKFSPSVAPVMDLSRKRQTGSLLKPVKAMPLPPGGLELGFNVVPQSLKEDKVLLFGEILVKDEYNPTAPTEYFSHKQKRDARVAKEKAAKMVAERLHQEHLEEEAKRKSGACFAPPSFLMEPEPKVEVKQEPVPTGPIGPVKPAFVPKNLAGTGHGISIAASIMSKMGYREGSGLGRSEQGMSTALTVERLGKGAGIIKSEITETIKEGKARFESKNEAGVPKSSMTEVLKQATKILVLRNMVSPKDVDESLESEIREEMKKYGQVNEVRVHTMSELPDDEAVRIFVEFTNVAQAIKAFVDMNERFFAGRPIKTGFYSLDEFRDDNLEEPVNS